MKRYDAAMASPQSKTVVIVCPHCTTRYQVPGDTVGPKGRQVQCAHCSKTWQAFAEKIIEPVAKPPPPKVEVPSTARSTDDDRMFDADAEAELDAQFDAEQRAAAEAAAALDNGALADVLAEDVTAAIAPKPREPEPEVKKPPSAAVRKLQKAFSKRQLQLTRQLPMARVRRTLRVIGLATLALLLVSGFTFRSNIVLIFPDLAGAYAALGLKVNVVGLEFRDVTTLRALHAGAEVMEVNARVYSVAGKKVKMPPVVVTLLDAEGARLYEWSVAPTEPSLGPGEAIDFHTQITSPPQGAARVRLSFANGQGQSQGVTPASQSASVALPSDALAEPSPAHSKESAH